MSDRLPPARRRMTEHRRWRRWLVTPMLLALVCALLPVLAGPAQAAGRGAGRAYVGNDGSVSVLDVAKHTVVATIPAAYGIRDVAVNAAGTRVYTADHGMGTYSVINTATNTVIGTVDVPGQPTGVAVSPNGRKVYGTRTGGVDVIDTATNALVTTITGVGIEPFAVQFSPDGGRAYVPSLESGVVAVIDTASSTVITLVGVGGRPRNVAVAPDGSRVYVVSISPATVSVIDTATNTVTATISVGELAYGIGVSPDGSRLYVTGHLAGGGAGLVIVDTATNTVTATRDLGSGGTGLDVDADPTGRVVYVVQRESKQVSVLHAVTGVLIAEVPVGSSPHRLAFGPPRRCRPATPQHR